MGAFEYGLKYICHYCPGSSEQIIVKVIQLSETEFECIVEKNVDPSWESELTYETSEGNIIYIA